MAWLFLEVLPAVLQDGRLVTSEHSSNKGKGGADVEVFRRRVGLGGGENRGAPTWEA